MMKKKYNAEKVLYFADGDQGLHVLPSEKDRNTDLHQIVTQQLAAGHIQLAATDDAGDYYTITTSGKISLLVRQINWRKRNGKCIEKHSAELDRLTHEQQAHSKGELLGAAGHRMLAASNVNKTEEQDNDDYIGGAYIRGHAGPCCPAERAGNGKAVHSSEYR